MRTKIFLVLCFAFLHQALNLSIFANCTLAINWQTYPKDGRFKLLSPDRDPWYFVDEKNWYIVAPDKWQHFSGCYIGQKLFSRWMNQYFSAAMIAFLGIVKEYDDAYREGWSNRDLLMNFLGIFAAMNKSRYQLYCSFDREKILLNLSFGFR